MKQNYKRNLILQVLVTVILLSLAGTYYVLYQRDKIRKEKYSDLSVIASMREEKLVASVSGEYEDAGLISADIFLIERVKAFLTDKSSKEKILLTKYLKRITAEHDLKDVFVTNLKRELLVTSCSIQHLIEPELHSSILQSINTKSVLKAKLFYSNSEKRICYDFIAPILDEKNKPMAIIVFRNDTDKSLFSLINKWPIHSQSGEQLLVRRDNDNVLFLNDLRFKKDTALKLRVPLSETNVPAVQAVLGKKGVYEGVDYRGENVLSDLRSISGTNWYLVTKIDEDEIFAELNYRTILTVLLVLILTFFVVSAFAVFHYYRSRMHYRVMFEKEREIRAAHEEFRTTLYSIGDGVITTDTDANVKQMNYVAEGLTGWKEFEAKGKPIQEVFKIINEDSRRKVENPVERVLREGVVVGLANHTLLVSKNGAETPIADSGAPIRQKDGSIEGVVLVFRDQIEEREAKKTLEEKEFWLRESQRVGEIGSYDLDITSGVWTSSAVLDDIFGIEADAEKTVLSWNGLIHNDHKEEMLDYFLNYVVKEKQLFNKEYKIVRVKDGATRWVWGHGELSFDNAGNPIRMFGTIQDITERKLLESKSLRLANIVESSLNEIYIFDSETLRFEYVNFGALSNMKYTLEEMKNLTPVDIKPEFTEEQFRNAVQPLLSGEKAQLIFETVHSRKNGTNYPVEIHLQVYEEEGKKLFFAIINDITLRKQNEKALIEREKNLAVTLQSIGDAVITTDINGFVTNLNYVAETLTGYSLSEALGLQLTSIFNIVNVQTRTRVENPVERVIKEGEIIGLANHTVLISRDGTEHQISDSAAPIKLSNGEVIGVVLVFRDQTEEYDSKMKLEENEKKLRMIFDSSPDAITISKLSDGKFVDFNKSFYAMSGYTKENAIGKSAAELNIWSNPLQGDIFVKKLQSERVVDNMELTFRRKNGTEFFCYSSARLITVNGEICILAITRDVTEKIQSAREVEAYKNNLEYMIEERTKELNEANQKLKAEIDKEKEIEAKLEENLIREKDLNQLKSRFISTTSHEFRTPLTTVLSSAELIQRNIKKITEEKLIEYTERIKNSVHYLTNLLNEVITINKADSGKLKHEPRKINLFALCSEVLETASIFAKQEHEVIFNYMAEDREYVLDEKLMRFILSNLLANAFKYSPSGGKIIFDIQDSKEQLIFNVTDEGVGIPDEDKLLLFEPFHRSKNCEDIPGTGLGLSIVKRSVEIQNGSISFESEVTKGTCFMVKLPSTNLEGS